MDNELDGDEAMKKFEDALGKMIRKKPEEYEAIEGPDEEDATEPPDED